MLGNFLCYHMNEKFLIPSLYYIVTFISGTPVIYQKVCGFNFSSTDLSEYQPVLGYGIF